LLRLRFYKPKVTEDALFFTKKKKKIENKNNFIFLFLCDFELVESMRTLNR
jgi:hypothetical protein